MEMTLSEAKTVTKRDCFKLHYGESQGLGVPVKLREAGLVYHLLAGLVMPVHGAFSVRLCNLSPSPARGSQISLITQC